MPQADIKKAQQLIKQKQYNKARDILLKSDDPAANRWLMKIDELKKGKGKSVSFPIASLLLMCVSIAVTLWMFANQTQYDPQVIIALVIISGVILVYFCIRLFIYLNRYVG